jgi:hypothetical protein
MDREVLGCLFSARAARRILLHMASKSAEPETFSLSGDQESRVTQLLQKTRYQVQVARITAAPRMHEALTKLDNVSVARPPHCLAQAEYDPLAGGCRTAGQPGLLRARCQLRGKLNVWRRIERRRYVVSWVSAAWGAFHFHGSSVSSSCRLVRPDTMRLSTSVSQANGSTSLSFAD